MWLAGWLYDWVAMWLIVGWHARSLASVVGFDYANSQENDSDW